MDDEQIEQLIRELRAMLLEAGFGWAVDQAQAGLFPFADRYWTARSLIDAAEAVTIELADAEIRTLDILGVEDVHFKPDVDEDDVGDVPLGVRATSESMYRSTERISGPQRRARLDELAAQRTVFTELRRQLDGDV